MNVGMEIRIAHRLLQDIRGDWAENRGRIREQRQQAVLIVSLAALLACLHGQVKEL